MKNEKIRLRDLSISSFVTSLNDTEKVRGGNLCPGMTFAGPGLCVTGDLCETRVEEGCHSTGNTDDPTGFVPTMLPDRCLSGN